MAKQRLAMCQLTNMSLAEWEEYEQDNPPEYIQLIEDAATDEEIIRFIQRLKGLSLSLGGDE
jgi:hypothetical protein